MAEKETPRIAKTLIGGAAAKKAAERALLNAKDWPDYKERVRSAMDQADDEVKRETRGQVAIDEPLFSADRRAASDELKRESRGKGMKKGGSVSSASKRADGCAVKGKTKGRMV